RLHLRGERAVVDVLEGHRAAVDRVGVGELLERELAVAVLVGLVEGRREVADLARLAPGEDAVAVAVEALELRRRVLIRGAVVPRLRVRRERERRAAERNGHHRFTELHGWTPFFLGTGKMSGRTPAHCL